MRHALTLRQPAFKKSPFTLIRFVALLGIVLLISGAAPATIEKTKADKNEKPVELHNLDNEQLLKQAQLILGEASARFLAQLRGLYKINQVFKQAQLKTGALVIPGKNPKQRN